MLPEVSSWSVLYPSAVRKAMVQNRQTAECAVLSVSLQSLVSLRPG